MDDVKCVILSKLGMKSLLNMRTTDKYYHNYISNKKLKERYSVTIFPKNVKSISEINNGRGIINISYNLVIDKQRCFSVTNLQQIPNIESLQILNKSMSDKYVQVLTDLKCLVLIDKSKITTNCISQLTNLQYLRSTKNILSDGLENLIKLTNLDVDQKIASHVISKLTSLTSLNSYELKADDIKQLTKLTSIRLSHNCDIDICESLSSLPQLTDLNIGMQTPVTSKELIYLTMLKKLQLNSYTEIKIGDWKYLTGLTDLSVTNNIISNEHIKQLTNLTRLKLFNNHCINEPGLRYLTKLIDLELIDNQTKIYMGFITQLRKLSLNRRSITSNNELNKLTGLISLDLISNDIITDEGIQNLTRLTKLNLNGNKNITAQGIQNLTNLQDLIFHNSNITIEAINKLLPKLIERM